MFPISWSTMIHVVACLLISLTTASSFAPITSMAALPKQTAMPPPLPGQTRYQTITIAPNDPIQEGFPYNTIRTSGIYITSLDIKHPLLSSCWNDYMSSESAYLTIRGMSTSIYYTTERVKWSYGINTSVPLIIRCDGRSYIPADSRLAFATTIIHPPSKTTKIQGFLWTPDPKCFSLKVEDCAEAFSAYDSAKASAVSSLYSQFWPSVPKLAANRSTTTTIIIPRNGGIDGVGGLPYKIEFSGDVLRGPISGPKEHAICPFGVPHLTCPARKDIEKCQLAVPEMTVYYWPTSSAGNYCDKTRIPPTMTKPGEPNSALIIYTEHEGFKTMVTSPTALVYIPRVIRQHPTVTDFGAGPSSTWGSCGSHYETSAVFQIHPDDLSSVNPHYVSTAAVWTTERNYGSSVHSTLYKYGLTTERVDLAAVYNPAWIKQYPYDNTAACEGIWNGAIDTNAISTTITQSQVASMKQSNCSIRVLDVYMSPPLAIPKKQLFKVLDQEWLNWGGKPDGNGEPFCKPETSSILFQMHYIALTDATIIGTGSPRKTNPPAVTMTVTTIPPE